MLLRKKSRGETNCTYLKAKTYMNRLKNNSMTPVVVNEMNKSFCV